MKPDISVIVTNYNHSQYIKEAIESILWQTKKEFEVIIVDDCSIDNSKEIIEDLVKLDDRIQAPIYLSENKGKWFALNTAIEIAKGKIITLNDADDVSCQDRFERQFHVLKTHNSFGNLCGFHHCYNQEQMNKNKLWHPSNKSYYDVIGHDKVLQDAMIGFKHPNIGHFYTENYEIHGASMMWYKQFWTRGIKFNPNGLNLMIQAGGEDTDHNLRLTFLTNKVSILREPLYCYRRGVSTNPSWTLGK